MRVSGRGAGRGGAGSEKIKGRGLRSQSVSVRGVAWSAVNPQAMMDLLGSIMGSMDKPPTASEREKNMQKGGRLLVASRERAGEA